MYVEIKYQHALYQVTGPDVQRTWYLCDRNLIVAYLINFEDPQTGQAKANILSLQAHTSPLIDSPQQGGFVKRTRSLKCRKVIRWASCSRDTMRCSQPGGGNHYR